MESGVQTLSAILTGGGGNQQHVIPVYQRNYSWGKDQWLRLWEDLEAIEKAPEGDRHFMGFLVSALVSAPYADQAQYYLVDGQQRLTTSSILLAAIKNVAKVAGDADLADQIHEDYLVHRRLDGNKRYRLLPKTRERDQYKKLVEGEVPEGDMGQALEFFTEKVRNYAQKDTQKITRLSVVARKRLEFVSVTLASENAYEIFRSLNSKNVRLQEADLIRDFVFTGIKHGKHDTFDRETWQPLENLFVWDGAFDSEWFSRFFRDRLMSDRGDYVPPEKTFDVFGNFYRGGGF